MKPSFFAGFYGIYNLSKQFSIEVDFYYAQMGAIVNTDATGTCEVTVPSLNPLEDDIVIPFEYALSCQNYYRNDYFCIPLLARYNIGETGLSVMAGFRTGFLLDIGSRWDRTFVFESQQGVDFAPGIAVDNVLNDTYGDLQFKAMDYSLQYGISYRHKDFPIWLDARGTYVLNNVSATDGTTLHNVSYEFALLFEIF